MLKIYKKQGSGSPFHQSTYMELCFFQPGGVARRCHSCSYVASSRLASLEKSSILFRNRFGETDY